MPPNPRWEGQTDVRIEVLEAAVRQLTDRVGVMELVLERNKGRIEGGKAMALLIGAAVGAVINGMITWFSNRG